MSWNHISSRGNISTYLFVAAFASASLLLLVIYLAIGAVTAIKGSYVLLGTLLAFGLYGDENDTKVASVKRSSPIERYTTKVIAILVLSAYLAVYTVGGRFWVTSTVLLIGCSLLAVQFLATTPTRETLIQIALLFTVEPVTKYLSTGFYYGATDLFSHVRAVELLIRTGQINAINEAYSTYSDFPALHLTSAVISSFTGLPAYDSLIVLGIVTFTTVLFAVYYIGRSLFSPQTGVMIAFIFSSLSLVHYYAAYFFPQSFATALFLFLLYVVVRREQVPKLPQTVFSLYTVLIVGALVFAHHVTQIIIFALATGLYLPALLRKTKLGRQLDVNSAVSRHTSLLFASTAGVTYLALASRGVISYFLRFVTDKADNATVSDSGGQRAVVGLGTDIPYHTPTIAFKSLFSVDGLYYIGLFAIFLVGAVVILVRYKRYARTAGFLLLGIFGSLTVLKTPFVNTLSRLSLPFTFFFSVVAGIGLWRLVGWYSSAVERSGDRRQGRIAVFVLIVLVGITGPLVAADDMYGLHAGPNLWETYSTPEQQVEFSEQELQEFEFTDEYVDRYASKVTMLWVSEEASGRFGGEERLRPTSVSEEGIRAEGPLVYRTAWTEHQVGYSTGQMGTVSIADWWFQREINATNKVYSTGRIGVVWEDEIFLSNNRSVTNETR